MKHVISQQIKALRKKRGITQKELADGICTQAMISNFEKGEVIPSSLTLFAIAQRLGVDMNYFFGISSSHRTAIKATDAQQIIRKLVHRHDYQSAYFIVQNELVQEALIASEHRQFLLWHKGICLWFLHKELDAAIQTLEEALQIDSEQNAEQTAAIMNSIAAVYAEAELYENSLTYYEQCLLLLHGQTPISYLVKISIYFGASRTLKYLTKYDEAILLAKQGIQLCMQNESLYLLGDLLFQEAHSLLISSQDKAKGTLSLEQAKVIFTLQNKFADLKLIENLQSKK